MKNLLSFLIITTALLNAQIDTLWSKTFGGEFEDRGYRVVQSNDGGYIIVGRKATGLDVTNSDYKAWVLKTDSLGNKEWDIEIGDSLQNFANSITKTQDGNYVIGITKNGSFLSGSYSANLTKIDDLGNIIWEVDYPSSVAGWIWDINSTIDTGLVFVGSQSLVMTDSLGNILWNKNQSGISVTPLEDGGVVVTTSSNDVIKYNRDGVEVWEQYVTPTHIWSLIETSSGLIGVGADFDNPYLIALSPTGEIIIDMILDIDSRWLFDIVRSNDGGYYISGSTYYHSDDGDDIESLLIMKITLENQEPEILWSKVYGGEQSDRAYGMILSNEGNITIAGRTSSYGNGQNDLWLLKMASETLAIEQSSLSPKEFALFQNYPNPFNPSTTLHYYLPIDGFISINIYDMRGNFIKNLINSNQSNGFKSVQWNATNSQGQPVSAGVYLYSIETKDFRQTKKMILLK